MARRRKQRRAKHARRHLDRPRPTERDGTAARAAPADRAGAVADEPRVVVREADFVVRLAYNRTQAAQALGISRSTLRRLLPYVETIEMPWGGTLIPIDELERLVAERRQAALARRLPARPGRKPSLLPTVVERIRTERAAGRSLRQIAADLNASGTPTVHGGSKWWPSTVRSILRRQSRSYT